MQTFVLQSNVWAKYTKKYLEFSLKSQQLNPIALILHAQMYSDNLRLHRNLLNSDRSQTLFLLQKYLLLYHEYWLHEPQQTIDYSTNVSTTICRLRPLIFLPPSKPLSCALETVLTLCESIMASVGIACFWWIKRFFEPMPKEFYPISLIDWLCDRNSIRLNKVENHWAAYAIGNLFW